MSGARSTNYARHRGAGSWHAAPGMLAAPGAWRLLGPPIYFRYACRPISFLLDF